MSGRNAPAEWWDEFTTAHQHNAAALADLTAALRQITPRVLGTITVALDVNGCATGQFRVPFQCITVDSQSAKALIVANSPLGAPSGPGPGPGVGFVRIGGFVVLNANGYAWSVYGGNVGELVTVTAYANPQQPYVK